MYYCNEIIGKTGYFKSMNFCKDDLFNQPLHHGQNGTQIQVLSGV